MEQDTSFGRCKRCQSDQTAAIQVIVEQGTTSGVGIGVSRGGVGVGGYGSTTGLAAKYRVGNEPRPVIASIFLALSSGYSILVLMGLIAALSQMKGEQFFTVVTLGSVIFLLPGVCVVLFCLAKIRGLAKEREVWERKRQMHDRGWVCLRCGFDWIP